MHNYAIRLDFAGAPISIVNFFAYSSSTSDHGTSFAIITHRLSSANFPPNGSSKFSDSVSSCSAFLYIICTDMWGFSLLLANLSRFHRTCVAFYSSYPPLCLDFNFYQQPLSSRDRLQGLLSEAREQVNLARSELAQIRAGAKTGEIDSQKAEIARIQAQSSGEERAQQESIARLEAQWLGDRNAQQAALAGLEEQLAGDIRVQSATIKKLTAELNNARSELQRYQQLASAGAISQSQYATRRLSVDTAVQQLNEAQAALTRTKTTGDRKIREAKANLQRTIATGSKQISEAKVGLDRIRSTSRQQEAAAQATLSKISEVRPVDVRTAQVKVNQTLAVVSRVETELAQATVKAPIDGRILEIFAKPGEVVKDNGIVNLGQTDRMQVVAEIDQGDINKIRVGQSVLITGEAFAGDLRGTVSDLGLEVSRQSTFADRPGENLDRRVVKVRIHIDPADS
jgi:HlyD family secretion protein